MIMIYVVGQGPSGIMLAYMIKKLDPNVPLTLIDKNKKKNGIAPMEFGKIN